MLPRSRSVGAFFGGTLFANGDVMRRSLLALVLVLSGCTNGPVPTGDDVLVRIEISGSGEIVSVTPEIVPPDSVSHARPTTNGELLVEVLDGDDVTWSGRRHVPYFAVSEEFHGAAGISGRREPVDFTVHYLAFRDDGRPTIPLRLSLVPPDGGPAVVTEPHARHAARRHRLDDRQPDHRQRRRRRAARGALRGSLQHVRRAGGVLQRGHQRLPRGGVLARRHLGRRGGRGGRGVRSLGPLPPARLGRPGHLSRPTSPTWSTH